MLLLASVDDHRQRSCVVAVGLPVMHFLNPKDTLSQGLWTACFDIVPLRSAVVTLRWFRL